MGQRNSETWRKRPKDGTTPSGKAEQTQWEVRVLFTDLSIQVMARVWVWVSVFKGRAQQTASVGERRTETWRFESCPLC